MPSRPEPISVVSDDPEVMALQTLIRGLRHFGSKPQLGFRHFKVLAGVELACRVLKRKSVKLTEVEGLIGLKAKEFESHVMELVDLRYLHEVIPTFGEPVPTYKIGSMGGTAVRTMFRHFHPTGTKEANNG